MENIRYLAVLLKVNKSLTPLLRVIKLIKLRFTALVKMHKTGMLLPPSILTFKRHKNVSKLKKLSKRKKSINKVWAFSKRIAACAFKLYKRVLGNKWLMAKRFQYII